MYVYFLHFFKILLSILDMGVLISINTYLLYLYLPGTRPMTQTPTFLFNPRLRCVVQIDFATDLTGPAVR